MKCGTKLFARNDVTSCAVMSYMHCMACACRLATHPLYMLCAMLEDVVATQTNKWTDGRVC